MKSVIKTSLVLLVYLLLWKFGGTDGYAQTPNNSVPEEYSVEQEDGLLGEIDALEDFAEETIEATSDSVDQVPSFLEQMEKSAKFSLGHQIGYAFQKKGKVVTQRSSIRLEWDTPLGETSQFHFDGKVTVNHHHDHVTQAQSSSPDYHITQNLREIYLQSSWETWSLKVGKQIVIWGESERSVVDEVSPRDQTEVHFTALEDARIGQTMAMGHYFLKQQEWSFFVNPDVQTNRLPEENTEYYIPLPDDDERIQLHEDALTRPEMGVRWKHTLGTSDLSMMVADLNENSPRYQIKAITHNSKGKMDKVYPRYQLIGIAGNFNFGNYLLKGELAYKANRGFEIKHPLPGDALVTKDTWDVSLGMEYLTNDNATYLVGLSNQHLLDWEKHIDQTKDQTNYYFAWSKAYLNQTLQMDYTLNYAKQSVDTLHQIKAKYTLMDDLLLQVQVVYFDPSHPNKGLGIFKYKSRATASLTYYF